MKRIYSVLVLVVMICFLYACNTGVVPPGTAVLKLSTDGSIQLITQGTYTVQGRDVLCFVDTKIQSFTEKLRVLCADDVNMEADIKWIGSFDISSKENARAIKEKVPIVDREGKSYMSLPGFYKTAMSDIVRNSGRIVIAPYVTDSINKNRQVIEAAIKKLVVEKLAKLKYPIATSDVLVSNLDFGEAQTKQREAIKNAELEDKVKAAKAKADLAELQRDAEKARERGKALIETAKAEAAANNIISDSLTPTILMLKQYEAFKAMAAGPNNEAMIIPYEAITPQNMTAFINKQTFGKK